MYQTPRKIKKKGEKDMDIIHEIEKISYNKTTHTHVYGHQDEKEKKLNIEEYFNTIVDKIATSNAQYPAQIHPPSQNAIYINSQYIPYNFKKYLKKQYMHSKQNTF